MGLLTQEDPIGLAGGLNLYGYANGDPINFSDPFGLFAEDQDCPTCERQMGISLEAGRAGGAEAAGLALAGVAAAGAGIALAAGVEAAVASQTVNLFRAVSQAELTDITTTGAFRAGPNSLGGKWFWTTVDDAVAFGQKMGGEFSVIRATMGAKAVEGMMHMKKLDNIGPAVYGEIRQLAGAVIRAIR